MKRPSIKSPCVADHHASAGERIAEFGTPHGGGLISVRDMGDHARVEVYRCDDGVKVVNSIRTDTAHAAALRRIQELMTGPGCFVNANKVREIAAEALGGAAPASPPSVAGVLARAESFIAGFEDDELQEGIPELLRDLRAAQGKEG